MLPKKRVKIHHRTDRIASFKLYKKTTNHKPSMKIIFTLILVVAISGCSTFRFPGVHRVSIQQGNVVSQQMIDKLRPGMTKGQVRFILGNPVIDDPLDRDRWDYAFTIQIGGGKMSKRKLALFFLADRLSYFEGNYVPSELADLARSE